MQCIDEEMNGGHIKMAKMSCSFSGPRNFVKKPQSERERSVAI